MFSLIYGFYEYLSRKEELNVLLIGLERAGKTNALEKIKSLYSGNPGLEPHKITPTVGLNIGRVDFASSTKLVIWDLGGQAGLQKIWDKYYSDCHALVFVIDCTDSGRFEEAKHALDRALGSRDTFGAPLLVLASKADAVDAHPADEIASSLGLTSVTTRPHKVIAVSSFTGQGLADGLSWLVTTVQKSNRTLLLRQRTGK